MTYYILHITEELGKYILRTYDHNDIGGWDASSPWGNPPWGNPPWGNPPWGRALPGPPRAPPEPPRADSDLHSLPGPPELSRDVFFYFFMMSQLKPLVLRAFLAGHPPKKALKSRRFSWDIHEQKNENKNHAIAPLWPKVWECCSNTSFWEFARQSPGSCGSGVRECGSDPTFHTRRGPGWR